ncbi:discoidin domain-containing protein [Dactylosporangium sp. CA-092794]|uniref:discoidin domain-containing protein n=1 Tax=Dactylosporangium sp. CA-092794 TaxID=3239929 RepID=UPI003D8EC0A2
MSAANWRTALRGAVKFCQDRGVTGRRVIAWGLPAVCVAGIIVGLRAASAQGGHPGRVPAAASIAEINAAALSCPALTPARLAGQIMVNSRFDAGARNADGGEGIAGLTPAVWTRWAPWPDANRGDQAANTTALAHAMCDLVGNLRLAGVGGDPWRTALAAYNTSFDTVRATGTIPDSARSYVDEVADYAEWYASLPGLNGSAPSPSVLAVAASAPPSAAGSAEPSSAPPSAGPSSRGAASPAGPPVSLSAAPVTGAPPTTLPPAGPTSEAPRKPTEKLSVNRPSTASSVLEAGLEPQWAFDTDYTDTRWASRLADNQWIAVDLGSARTVTSVILRWQDGYAKRYVIQASPDNSTWTNIYADANGNGGSDHIAVPVTSARYVRLWCITRGVAELTFSLYDFEVLGY